MKFKSKLAAMFIAVSASIVAVGCSDSHSYADLLIDENHAVNYYLADHRVINSVPADSVFEYGPDAPFYRLNDESTLYMQVINPGDLSDKAVSNQLIYFRFTRYNLKYFMQTGTWIGDGNASNLSAGATSFRFMNKTNSSAQSYGTGIQAPLEFLGIGCEVNIIIKSQLGPSNEIASVIPYLYNVRYFESPL